MRISTHTALWVLAIAALIALAAPVTARNDASRPTSPVHAGSA